MKLENARGHYYTFTESLSSVNRQLCFAGIAVIWIFSVGGENGQHFLDSRLFLPLAFLVLGLAGDLLHYVFAAASWGIFHRKKEKSGIGEDAEFEAPAYINWIPLILFWGKVLATIIGYIILMNLITNLILDNTYNL